MTRYWNWFNESAVEYYLNELVLPQASKLDVDGFFFDGSDGFMRGTWKQAINVPRNATDEDALAATVSVHRRGAELLAAHSKYPIYSEHLDDTTPAQQAWIAAAMRDTPYFRFYEGYKPSRAYIESLLNETQRASQSLPVVVHAGTSVAPHLSPITDSLAAFLIVQENYSYFMASAGWLDGGWSWHPEYDVDYGTPLGPALAVNTAGGTVYTRRFTRCTVTVNCTDDDDDDVAKHEVDGHDVGKTIMAEAPSSTGFSFNCSVFGCTCQGFANYYGTHAGHGFGCPSEPAKQWWITHRCNANANCPCCKGPACSLPGAAPCICPSYDGMCRGTITLHDRTHDSL